METLILKDNPNDLKKAAELLLDFEVVAFPTETVYGLGAIATSDDAIKKVFAAKNRPSDNPLIITVSSIEMVERFADIDKQSRKLIEKFWPGSLTLILNLKDDANLPDSATAGLKTAAFRMPDNRLTLDLIKKIDTPIVGPSANLSTIPSPTTAQHVIDDLDGVIAAVIDGGPTEVGVESTIIDISESSPVILRPGKITALEISEVLNQLVTEFQNIDLSGKQPKAPGMKYRHYAPGRPVITFDELDLNDLKKEIGNNDVVIATDEILNSLNFANEKTWSLGSTLGSASEQLFAGLRVFDRSDVETIYVQRMPENEIGIAYNNRLNKASGGRRIENN